MMIDDTTVDTSHNTHYTAQHVINMLTANTEDKAMPTIELTKNQARELLAGTQGRLYDAQASVVALETMMRQLAVQLDAARGRVDAASAAYAAAQRTLEY